MFESDGLREDRGRYPTSHQSSVLRIYARFWEQGKEVRRVDMKQLNKLADKVAKEYIQFLNKNNVYEDVKLKRF